MGSCVGVVQTISSISCANNIIDIAQTSQYIKSRKKKDLFLFDDYYLPSISHDTKYNRNPKNIYIYVQRNVMIHLISCYKSYSLKSLKNISRYIAKTMISEENFKNIVLSRKNIDNILIHIYDKYINNFILLCLK